MIEVYIGSERLDLFKDEDVNIKLSVQNIKDISKIFADYTQNFSVPASRTNNAVFKHYYNADISGGFDASLRKSATLILDKEPFREGSIELLGVNMKNGIADSYEIVFFSAGVNLKDLFGEDELTDLDLSAYDHEYTGANVRTGAESGLSSGNIIYPLISPVEPWFYDSSSSSHQDNDIAYHTTNDDHGVHYYSLKPAIRLARIVDAIESKYNITFNSTFFASDKFTNLYMWCHRREGFMFKDQENGWNPVPMRYQTTASSSAILVDDGGNFVVQGILTPDIDFIYDVTIVSGTDVGIYFYVNGVLFTTKSYSATASGEVVTMNGLKKDDVISIKYGPSQGSAGASFEFSFSVELKRSGTTPVIAAADTGGVLMTFDNDVVIADQMPEQKISDFITGLVKMFNLTIESTSATQFTLEPLDDWYASGSTYDITDFTDISSHKVAKPELYRRLKLEHQLADSIAMRQHRLQNGGLGYGDLRADFTFDGGELTNQTTFELLRFDKLIDVNTSNSVDFLIGKSIDKDLEPYIGEPIIFYSNGQLDISSTPIGFLDETGLTPSPADPMNDCMFIANVDNSTAADVSQMLTFGLEIDPYHEQAFNQTLYGEFWEDYITDLYSTSRRVYNFKAILPMTTIYQLKMNDKLVIAGKRYIINEVNLNLRTREATLELLNDV
jgi:hypothetical protein